MSSPIVACLLRHGQAHQLLLVAQAHGPFWVEAYEIHITADFSKETNDRRKAFLALRPQLRQLEMKYALFELARMWVTNNGVSINEPEDLCLFLDGLLPQSMDTNTPARPQVLPTDTRSAPPPPTTLGESVTMKQTILLEVETLRDSQGHMTTGGKYYKRWHSTPRYQTGTSLAPP
ncbi:hypothetical protein NDU88_003985 [Pleurodeles waltl]|uniref:SCAN box domain-containing protein n=1 Tax=Pleurodeles waltl TaxID=8319 RepID=A0AAV7NI37_PLEWA|nr:hypothetical protein NDU88_003985 [Pleurodeles waltl]